MIMRMNLTGSANQFLSALLGDSVRQNLTTTRLQPGMFMALIIASLFAATAHAAAPPPTYGANVCPSERYGSKLNCTANDVRFGGNPTVTRYNNQSVPSQLASPSCVFGDKPVMDLNVFISPGSSSRYKLGLYIGNDGANINLLKGAGGGNNTCSNYPKFLC